MKYVIVIVSGIGLLGLLAYIASTRYYESKREESHREKIVGTWYPPTDERGKKYTLEFTKDDKLIISLEEEKVHGTYMITGDELTVVIMYRGKEAVSRLLIKKLTYSELIFENKEFGRSFVFHQER